MGSPEARVETGVREYLLQDEMVVRLAKIQKLQESQIPDGVAEFASITVSGSQYVFDVDQAAKFNLRGPWMACNVTNRGSADVQYSVNDGVTNDTISPGDTREIDMKAKGKLYQLIFYPTVATVVRLAFTR